MSSSSTTSTTPFPSSIMYGLHISLNTTLSPTFQPPFASEPTLVTTPVYGAPTTPLLGLFWYGGNISPDGVTLATSSCLIMI